MQKPRGRKTDMTKKHKRGWCTWTILSLSEVEIDTYEKGGKTETIQMT